MFDKFVSYVANATLGILYASTSLNGEEGFQLLSKAVQALLSSVSVTPVLGVLWSIQYEQRSTSSTNSVPFDSKEHILNFPPLSLDLAFDDAVLDNVKDVWQKIMGDDAGDFMLFTDREADAGDEDRD